jgi:hypothetical protein
MPTAKPKTAKPKSSPSKAAPPILNIKNLGPIKEASIEFGNLTVLVGPQATGKSLILQMLKLCLDGKNIARELQTQGYQVNTSQRFLEQYLGEGMAECWHRETAVVFKKKLLLLEDVTATTPGRATWLVQEVYYVPAQRSLAMSGGWPRLFSEFSDTPPFVLRRYSKHLLSMLSSRSPDWLFQAATKTEMAAPVWNKIEETIFRGGWLYIDTDGPRKQLKLSHNGAQPAFSSWSTGQREFIPLILAHERLIALNNRKKPGWVVLEEPELGLHPQAILAAMLVVMDLLQRGYKVAISTHSPLVLDVVWALGKLQHWRKHVKTADVLALFGHLPTNKATRALAEAALAADCRVYYMDDHDGKGITSRDVSALDPGSDDNGIAGWGGLTGVSSQISDVVGRLAVRAEAAGDDDSEEG